MFGDLFSLSLSARGHADATREGGEEKKRGEERRGPGAVGNVRVHA